MAQRAARFVWSDDGVTISELLITMILFGILAALSAVGLKAVQSSLAARGAHRESVAQLREVQARSVAENTAYCVDFTAVPGKNWNVYRIPGADQGVLPSTFSCTSGTKVGSYTLPGRTGFSNVSFQQRNNTSTTYVLFYARGAASGGTFQVGGGGGSTYTISVDNLTGRVASSGA